jgi:hypothetical protein
MKAADYADVFARINRPLTMLTRCKIEKIKFKKPAKSLFAERPMGHPQKRSPAFPAAFWAEIANTAASELEPGLHNDFTPGVSHGDPAPLAPGLKVQELLSCVKDKTRMNTLQKIPKPDNILVL